MLLIGLCGRKRSGKGTLAAALESHLGFKRYAFGTKLKEVQVAMFPWIPPDAVWGEDRELPVFRSTPNMAEYLAPDVITSRMIQQALGQAIRKVMGTEAWIVALVDQINAEAAQLVVIEDIRQPNELDMVKKSGGYIIRTNRADRHGFHQYSPAPDDESGACCYLFNQLIQCGRGPTQHPISWTSDQHETEWALPEESILYDRVITTDSGEETAKLGVQFVHRVMP